MILHVSEGRFCHGQSHRVSETPAFLLQSAQSAAMFVVGFFASPACMLGTLMRSELARHQSQLQFRTGVYVLVVKGGSPNRRKVLQGALFVACF